MVPGWICRQTSDTSYIMALALALTLALALHKVFEERYVVS